MLVFNLKLPTKNIKIDRVLPKLFQAFIYHNLPEKEHQGYRHSSGKVFKSTNFKIEQRDSLIVAKFRALDREYERNILQKVILDGLKLGEIHISSTEIELKEDYISESMTLDGFVCANVKNSLTNRKIFLQVGDTRHTEIITKNIKEKYEVFFGKKYEDNLEITPIFQSAKSKIFHYENSKYIAWGGKYRVEATKEMNELIIATGLGSNTMRGLGFLEIIK